ncbi:hypothetical protein [Humisphaera borealis]|uniref:Uncharacterized protein n=1 Tax=Humisphaera borealis TaxID=2807512 RepID=A0A7M2X0T1_9BACT|nr:hypothetical protein [Humisphaera borealis]QOV91295.1 hypothetical protein IPV69_08040 [Humisphaera borealis]
MNGFTASTIGHDRPSQHGIRSRRIDWLSGAVAGALAVVVLCVGLRLTVDAAALSSRLSGQGYNVGPPVPRCLGVAALAAGELIAIVGVVWRGYRRGALDSAVVVVLATVSLLALFAAVVLMLAGRS